MDREKKQLKRSANKVKPLHVSDFIALGSKSSSRQTDSSEQKIKTKSTLISVSTSDRKTDVSGPSSSVPMKKTKISSSSASNIKRVSSASKKETVKSDEWDTIAFEVDSADLVSKVLEAEDCSDDEKVEALLCGAVKKLKSGRSKFDAPLYLSLQYLAKTRPFLFCSELTVEAFCSLLKRDLSINFKAKGNNLVPILASNILMAAYKDESNWPEVFVKAYVEDSLAERVWVDHDYCKGFVDNILTAFNTKSIPKSMMIPDRLFKPEACPSPPNIGTDDDESCSSVSIEIQENLDSVAVFPRYMHSEESLTQYVLDVIREQMTRRQPTEVSRNTLRFLVSTCGISEVRLIVSQKLEMWLQNPKLTKPAQELLLAVCLNCNQHNQHDVEVISQLIKIRIKAKPIINHYLLCMRELICQHAENLSTLLKHAIYNELSSSRNPNNMQLLSIIFQHSPDKAAKVLADVFLDLLCNRDDYLRALRALLREIVRTVRHDLSFSVFCSALLQEKKEAAFLELEMPLKERVFLSITDLIVLAIFLGVSPAVKEQFSTCSRGEKRDLTQLRNYQLQVSNIQRDSVYWLYSTVPKLFKPGRNEFIHSIHKLLFMEQIEHYYNKDNWPTESERMLLLRLASEVPLLEDTLTRVLIIGLSREHPLTAPDALELADQLIKRAAMTYCDDFPVLEFENTELCDLIFNLCAYHHPENITLPQGYHPPSLAISELYWKAWTMLLIIICHNPSTFGDMAWKTYPMLRNLMEMCITNQFVFPPPTLALGEKAEEIKNRELQMSQMEKDQILLFETHLAAASTKVTITESNSLLLSKLISMDPHGPARKPPTVVLEQLKAMNSKLKLGDLLCHSRNPDFLLDVIQRQGTTQSMSWLSELVESSASSFNMLPVQCLCEFLISDAGSVNDNNDDGERSCAKKKKKQEQLLFHLQKLLHEPDSEPHDTIEVISYFMKRLSSQQTSARTLALKGLDMLLYQPNKSPVSDDEDLLRKNEVNEYNWLSKSIPRLPHFDVIRSQISLFLRQACQIENDPLTIASYVTFLAVHTPDHNLQEFADLALDMAQMIVERPTIVNTILPIEGNCNGHSNDFLSSVSEIFFKYLSAAKIPSKEVYSWSESQDQILIQWASGESATMHILVVHAMIIVLTYGPPLCGRRSYFDALLEIWFPIDSEQPKAFLVDTSEEALLLPDWLKLRMIRSSVGVLVDAALKDLDPSQLVLFIQSFGIPVSSMSKLLRTLDLAVEFDSFSVEQAVLDKSYMSQLVEVQHRRGASGGAKFAKLLLDADSTEMNTDCDTVLNQTPVIQRAPPKLPTAIGVESVSISLVKLLGLNPALGVLSAKQEQDLFKGLQKALSKDILDKTCDDGAVSVFILTCEQILRSDSKMAFLQALHKKSYYSSVLFRLATASQAKSDINKSQLAQKLKWICQQIIYVLSAANSSLLTVASQYYNKHKPPETKKPIPWKLFMQQYADNLDSQNITNVVQLAETKDSLRLEEVMQYLVKNAISNGDTKPLMNAMTNITLKRLTDSASQSIQTFKRSKFCFFVDWLECLEPKIISSFPQSQCHLLFSLIGTTQESITVPFRPYLLALLIHQSSWEILHYYIQTVLNPNAAEIKFDPTSVLDFLHACIYIPKIWQGRYKKKNKRGSEEDILALSDFQIKSVINYILEEALMKCQRDVESSALIAKGISVIEWRMKLLLKCLALRRSLINSSVQHLLQIIKGGGVKSKLGSELLLQTYHQIPSVLTLISDCLSFLSEGSSAAKTSHCNLDIISHTLLISLARTDSSKHCIAKMARIEFICKKMASSHPVLLLRQLPMMTALLRGRIHLEYPLFRQQNHVTLFSCFLSILELLPPFLFKSEYCGDLNNILSLYMDVFQTYGSPKEIVQLLNRFLSFLLQYLAAKPAHARQFIQQYIDTLQELASQHQDLTSLRSILTGSCMHYWGAPGTASGSEEKMEASIHDVIAGLQFQSNVSQTHLSSIITRLSQGSSEDISVALQELESMSYKKPAILEHVVDNLKTLMHDSNAQFRMSAFNLVMRYVKNNPSRGLAFISSYLQCLESEQVDIVLTALEHLPEFVVLVQEYATVLLQKTFSVGIMKNINTASQIRGTIAYLVAQSGC